MRAIVLALVVGITALQAQNGEDLKLVYQPADQLTAQTLVALRAVAVKGCQALEEMKAYQRQYDAFAAHIKKTYGMDVHPTTLALIPPADQVVK